MLRKLLIALPATLLLPVTQAVAAPMVDVYAGAYTWDAGFSGNFASQGQDIDVEDDLDYDSARQNVLYLGVDHAVPLVPNVRLRHVDLSDDSDSTLTREFKYAGNTYQSNHDVSSRFQLDHTDLTLYYTPLDTVARVDFGLTVRQLDSEFEIRNKTTGDRGFVAADATLPMLHVAAGGDLPLTGFYARGEVNAVSFDGNDFTDARAAVGWRSDMVLGLELGYQQLDLTLDDVDDLDADMSVGGPYLALSLNF